MHGRPRKTSSSNPEGEAASAAKGAELRSLQSQFMSNHHQNIYTMEAIQLSEKLLLVNPEFYTAWNYRKLAVLSIIDDEESDPIYVDSVLDQELRVVASALDRNLKSYGAWYHRKWVLSKKQYHSSSSLDNELELLKIDQKRDLRNFHTWNCRRFVVELTKTSEEDELQYTADMINDETNKVSFSNYSAWHNRSVLLSSLVAKKGDVFMPKETIRSELDYVLNAIFTEEDNQSGWFYYLWLIDQTVKMETPLRISSWPSHGSIITLSGPAGCCSFNSSSSSSSKMTTLCSDSFPLILYFDEAVSGVSLLSTVSIESELVKGDDDIVWEPIPNKNSQVSCVWVARIKYNGTWKENNKVKVSLGGIVSSSSSSSPYEFVFTVVVVRNHDNVVGDSQNGNIVSWTGGGFNNWDIDAPSPEKNLDSPITLDTGFEWRKKTIEMEIECFRDLRDGKFGKLILAKLLMAEEAMKSDNDDDDVKGVHYEEILELYNDLMAIDSSHDRYYKDQHSVALLQKVTSSAKSLSRHLFRYRDMNNIVCLRLSNLRLTRIAAVEKLLFVQMLDLSHNEIHSSEGLEAMQLLCCLNLSHNRIRSFSALDSLRHLKQLSVLDVSHNHMKSTVATTHYGCLSPVLSDSGVPSKYWDVYLVLRDLMKLKQLDVRGNNDLIDGEEFGSFVRKVVPKLIWLNGHKLCS